ncbi:MAG: AEC family transporter [Deltaproteobacteria bacterium]
MNAIIIKIIPIILIFILGIVLRKFKIFNKENADLFLKLVFNVSIPAFVLTSISKIKLSLDFIYLPITAILIIIFTYFISKSVSKFYNLGNPSLGVFIVGSMIMNIGFTLPFFIAAYGGEGLARASIFDFGNALLTFTFIYYCACKFGGKTEDSKIMAKKLLNSPPLWALMISIILNLSSVKLHPLAQNFLEILGNITVPLIMLSLGIYFTPKIVKIFSVVSVIVIRMFVGLLLGFLFVYLFKLEGLNRLIVLIGASAPVGYNTLTFASMENLDKEYAASLVSYSILIGIIFIPFLIFILS